MYNLTHWSISVKNMWTVQHKLKISFRVNGYIYNHPEIPDGGAAKTRPHKFHKMLKNNSKRTH